MFASQLDEFDEDDDFDENDYPGRPKSLFDDFDLDDDEIVDDEE